jgi:hypothetical protein
MVECEQKLPTKSITPPKRSIARKMMRFCCSAPMAANVDGTVEEGGRQVHLCKKQTLGSRDMTWNLDASLCNAVTKQPA